MKPTILLLLCFVSCTSAGKNWAMLFSGATGYGNYAAQASMCHAYQVLHKTGIPDERIVIVMDTDLVYDPANPFPGKLFNSYEHIDVYKGTPLNYTGEDLSADLVLAVLTGNKTRVKELTGREGKVIESGPDDNVFVAAVGHGAPGVLQMPGRPMTAKELNKALQDMHDNKQFAKLVFYLESCESGSMFAYDLSKDLNIYAITASDPTHDASMNYCYDKDFPLVCLGGQFTTGWTENTEIVDISTYTFQQQSEAIKKAVNESHPQLYGDLSLLNLPLQDFFSNDHSRSLRMSANLRSSVPKDYAHRFNVPFNTMHLSLLQRQVKARPADVGLRLKLARLQAMMADVDRFFQLITRHVYPTGSSTRVASITESRAEPIRNWDCYEATLHAMTTSCPGLLHHDKLEGYFLSKFSALVNLCNRETGPVVAQAVLAASRQTELCQ